MQLFPRSFRVSLFFFAACLAVSVPAIAQEETAQEKKGGPRSDPAEVNAFASDYKNFISAARTAPAFVEESIRLAESRGFRELNDETRLRPGAKLYRNNRGRALYLFVVGREPFREGFRITAAHIDAPHLDLKARPIKASGNFVQLQTMPHGGIKNYQWVNRPLALTGKVYKKNGEVIAVDVGLGAGDPVFVIPDLAPHVDASQRKRSSRAVIGGEEMDPVAFSSLGKAAAADVEKYLLATYDIEPDDLVSAELSFVPAGSPADVGFDGSLIGAYGQDDRSSAYTALRALLELAAPRHTTMVFLANNEETGSNNNTGARSGALNDLLADLIFRQEGDRYRDVMTRRALASTLVVSADANPGMHPIWPASLERANAPQLGKGVNFKIYGRGHSPNAEFTARMRRIFDDAGVPWQVMTYKVGPGGGGTLGHYLSDDNMEVIDIGIPALSLHSPFEITSKQDVYSLYRAIRAFFENIDSNK